jgi:hypothetical protein
MLLKWGILVLLLTGLHLIDQSCSNLLVVTLRAITFSDLWMFLPI